MSLQQYFYFGLFNTCLRLKVYSFKPMKSNRLWKKKDEIQSNWPHSNTLDEQFIKYATAQS